MRIFTQEDNMKNFDMKNSNCELFPNYGISDSLINRHSLVYRSLVSACDVVSNFLRVHK